MERKGLVLLGLLFVLLLASQPMVAEAHTPGPITLEYDSSSEILTVTVTHSTSDVNSHYIYEITVQKNSVQVGIETYTSQSNSSEVVETFTVTAVDGDVLSATAKCSVSGQVTGQTTVTGTETITTSSTTTTTSTTTDSSMTTLLIATAIVAIGIVFVVIVVFKRR
ncbi:MAG: hypothetical protein RTV72_01260 [Candidatus Thorarchaeota archaeon]